MTILDAAKIKIFSKIIRKLEPSKAEYAQYEDSIRKSKLDSEMGYNAALGFVVLSRALTRALDYFRVFIIRTIVIITLMIFVLIIFTLPLITKVLNG